MRLRAIYKCLKHALLPWWLYEKKKHYDCSYWRHLWINICYAWRWITFQETESDIAFEKQANDVWVYGTVEFPHGVKPARKHRKKGNVQFVLWEAGEQGHKEDFWHNMSTYWWPLFKEDKTQQP